MAYFEVRSTARAAAAARLEAVAHQITEITISQNAARHALEEEVGQSDAVRDALLHGRVDTLALAQELSLLRSTASDGTLPTILLLPDGTPLFSIGSVGAGPDSAAAREALAPLPRDSLPRMTESSRWATACSSGAPRR